MTLRPLYCILSDNVAGAGVMAGGHGPPPPLLDCWGAHGNVPGGEVDGNGQKALAIGPIDFPSSGSGCNSASDRNSAL